jgi:hemolysin III
MSQNTNTGKPLLRGHLHQAMFFMGLGAALMLIFKNNDTAQRWTLVVYTVCALIMFGISALYHRIYWSVKTRLFWKKCDHAGIFLMIAGTFTPVAFIGLSEESSKTLLITVWSVALAGIIQSIFFVNVPKFISSLIYLIAGYLVVPYLSELHGNIGSTNTILMALGGASYSFGAIGYAFKKPVLNPKYFGYHEFFHVFVNIGAIFHFILISRMSN